MDPSSPKRDTFIGGGAFRVDRAQALEILRERQLADPADFLLAWLRAAVLSGASAARLASAQGRLELSFDGRPLDARFLQDPYAPLFDDASRDSERHAHLATGLLALLRLEPRRISILSGAGDGRSLLEVLSPTEERLSRSQDPGRETLLSVDWAIWNQFERYDCAARARDRCLMLPVPLTVDGERSPVLGPETRPGLPFTTDGLRGFLVPAEPGAAAGRAVFHLHGVRVCEEELVKNPPISAYLDDPRFTLNASQSEVVKNSRRDRALREARRRVPNLIAVLCPEQTRRYPGHCRALFQAWKESPFTHALAWGLGWLRQQPAPPETDSLGEAQEWDRTIAAWLRAACGAGGRDTPSALLDAPLFPGATGAAYSVRELREQAAEVGFIAASRSPAARGSLPLKIAWTPSEEHARNLERTVGASYSLRWQDDVLSTLGPTPGTEGGADEAQ